MEIQRRFITTWNNVIDLHNLRAYDSGLAVSWHDPISDLKRLGLRVPRDVSVLGYDGIALGALVEPPLATVVQPNTDIGMQAVTQLVTRLHTPDSHARAHVTLLPHGLRVSGTVAAPPASIPVVP